MRRLSHNWYKVQLGLALVLQVLGLAAPLAYGGNWAAHETGFLHPLWISIETYDVTSHHSSSVWTWFFMRLELILLVVWMLGLAGFLAYVLFSRLSLAAKFERLGNSFGGFAAQIIIAFFVARSIGGHFSEVGGEIEVSLQREFFILLFPIIFIYLARQRMRRLLKSSEK